ncbi:RluA family pseudouridine synthase [Kyrpidia spormannii]|uniref:Pseudouridine synthase n=1 Tax=Kyrpidia spormannii TaxID=2055160 RepID=A0A2K8N1Z0_9BACL|nr:RluA family pseudouridine synthase [Kyrpidia spormannii]ATY83596.1 RluA family pseudouridine synthase [Kyrpidia spormannii]
MVEYPITRAENGKKLHRFLRQNLPGLPLSGVYKWIRVGRVKVNRKKGKPDLVLHEGDTVQLFVSDEEYAALRRRGPKFQGVPRTFEILYEDGDLLVVNKPAGLLTHPDRQEHRDTLINRVLAYLYDKGEWDGRAFAPAAANRLDRNTSGIVLIGKHAQALRELADEIRGRRVDKRYLALVHGRIETPGTLKQALIRDHEKNRTRLARERRGRHGVAPETLEAETRYRPLAVAERLTLLDITLLSGRTHQIRAHLAGVGHPLVGDIKYGGKPLRGLRHQFLHAYALTLADGRRFVAPLPAELRKLLESFGLPTDLPAETSTST